jgi:hypothetical protein
MQIPGQCNSREGSTTVKRSVSHSSRLGPISVQPSHTVTPAMRSLGSFYNLNGSTDQGAAQAWPEPQETLCDWKQ